MTSPIADPPKNSAFKRLPLSEDPLGRRNLRVEKAGEGESIPGSKRKNRDRGTGMGSSGSEKRKGRGRGEFRGTVRSNQEKRKLLIDSL